MAREWLARILYFTRAVPAQGFFPASELAVHRSFMEKRGPLKWSPFVMLSSDHTHPRWRFQSHRRLKNVICHVEWLPDADAVATAPPAAVAPTMALTEAQKLRLGRIFEMYDADHTGALRSPCAQRRISARGRGGSPLASRPSGTARSRTTGRR